MAVVVNNRRNPKMSYTRWKAWTKICGPFPGGSIWAQEIDHARWARRSSCWPRNLVDLACLRNMGPMLISLLILKCGFRIAAGECTPCHLRQVTVVGGLRTCGATVGECRLIDMCELDSAASSAFVIPAGVRCLDHTTPITEAALPAGSTPDMSAVPLTLRSATTLTALAADIRLLTS